MASMFVAWPGELWSDAFPGRLAQALTPLGFVGVPLAAGAMLLAADRRWGLVGTGAVLAIGVPLLVHVPSMLGAAVDLGATGWWNTIFVAASLVLSVAGAAALVSLVADPHLEWRWPARIRGLGWLGAGLVVAVALLAAGDATWVASDLWHGGWPRRIGFALSTLAALVSVGVLIGVGVIAAVLRPWWVAAGVAGALAVANGIMLAADRAARPVVPEPVPGFEPGQPLAQTVGDGLQAVAVVALALLTVEFVRRARQRLSPAGAG